MRSLISLTLFVFGLSICSAQVSINNSGTAPDSSAMLDIQSTTGGVLIPRMTTAQREMINAPATGLLVFDLDGNSFWFFDGSEWQDLATGDNLGDHNATQTIRLNGHAISNDGDDEGIYVDNEGQVGIGTPAAQTDLHIHRNGGDIGPNLLLFHNGVSQTYTNMFARHATGANPLTGIGFNQGSQFRIGPVSDFADIPSGEVGLVIESSGHSGIGLNTPATVLEVQDTAPELRITDNTSNASGTGNQMGKLSWYSRDASFGTAYEELASINIINTNSTATPDPKMEFHIWNHPSGPEAEYELKTPLTLFPSGNLGIGSGWLSNDGDNEGIRISDNGKIGVGTAPLASLVTIIHPDDPTVSNACYIRNTNSPDGVLTLYGSTGTQGILYAFSVQKNNILTVEAEGDVGIGTGSPSYPLHVIGDAAKTTGSSWTAISDWRLKKDIRSYDEGLAEVLRIRPVQFKYNEESGFDTEENHIGVIAQEIQEIAPYMITPFQKDGVEYLGVNPSAMTYMFVNAFKELHAQNVELKAQIETILSKLESYKNVTDRVVKLEAASKGAEAR